MKKNIAALSLAFSIVSTNTIMAGGFYSYCPYCGGPIGNCYCYSDDCEEVYYEEDYCDTYYEEEEYDEYYEYCDSVGYSDYSGTYDTQMMHWANMRDESGVIIGVVNEGSYISIIGPDSSDASRTIIYDYSSGLTGSVSTVYIYGGSSYEYENPTEYGGGGYSEQYEQEDTTEYLGYENDICSGYAETDDTGYSEDIDGCGYAYYDNIWVDVDINTQTVNIYNGNVVILSSACVTGLPDIAETPCGQYYILNKERGSVLQGVDPNGVSYARAVDYWMPFTESGCGFHDATWRDSFGGDIYESYGSYGCVNCQYDFVEQMYDLVDTGCLVNIH